MQRAAFHSKSTLKYTAVVFRLIVHALLRYTSPNLFKGDVQAQDQFFLDTHYYTTKKAPQAANFILFMDVTTTQSRRVDGGMRVM